MVELLALLIEANQRLERQLEQCKLELQQAQAQLQLQPSDRLSFVSVSEKSDLDSNQKADQKAPQTETLPYRSAVTTYRTCRLKALVENAADMMLVIDVQGQIVDANCRACKTLGYSYKELQSLSIAEVDVNYQKAETSYSQGVAQVGMPRIFESVYRCKDGVTLPIEASVCWFEVEGTLLALALVRDISERKQAEVAMRRLADLGELAAMIVHEVRNPLTTVLMGLTMFEQLDLSATMQERLALALEEAERLKRLLNEILLYAKPQSLQAEKLEINELVSHLLGSLCSLVKTQERSVEMSSALPQAWVLGDRDKLTQVLINLIKNACEAISACDPVTLHIASNPAKNRVCVQINNGGEPIPPDVLAKLGTPFFTTKPSGNGLGLAIVKQIVEAHQGELQITSDATTGTTVKIALPLLSCDEWKIERSAL